MISYYTPGEEHYLQFEGVNSSAEVFFNGKSLGTHNGGYSAFRVKLSDIKDQNLLIVSVNNAPNDSVYPQQADFTFYGGIYRDVTVIGVSCDHFDLDFFGAPGLMVTPRVKGADADIEMQAFAEGFVRFEIIADGQTVITITAEGKNPTATATLEHVHLWDGVCDPYLYTLKATLLVDGEAVDEVSTRFGVRCFRIDPEKGFILNGREYPLRDYFGWYGGNVSMYGPWFDAFHKKYPDKPIGISEYGCEALNWHSSNPMQGDYTEEYQAYYHEEVIKQIMDRPYLWATHVWNMFDFAADARNEGGESGMNHKGLVTFDRSYKKDSFYAYKAWLSAEPFVHICGKRYIDRTEDITKVTVYTNQNEAELFANGKSIGKQKKEKYPFFYFEVKNEGETQLIAKAGSCSDSAVIRKVEQPNLAYILKEEGDVINWFEIETPAGYLSINDTLGDILATFRGKLLLLSLIPRSKGQ